MLRPGNLGHLGRLGLVAASQPSLVAQALAILAKYGAAANLYLPGVGAISGITAGNWLDSAGTTAAAVDGQVGRVDNARGGAHLMQSTAANRPVLRRGLVNQLLWSGNFSNATWLNSGVTVTSGQADSSGGFSASRLQAAGGAYRFIYEYTTWAAGQPATLAIRVKSYSGASQAFRLAYGAEGGLYSPIFTANDNWQIFTVPFTSVSTEICAVVSDVSGAGASAFDLVVERVGLFQGTVTASQILAAGGIPTTTTAPASSTNGPFAWQWAGSNYSFTSTLTPGNAGFFCTSANITDSGVLRTLLGAGAGSDASSGVWLARAASNALTLQVGNGTTRNSIGAPYPVATNAVASAGWDSSAMFVGINGTETSVAKTVNCTSANTINVGVLTGTTNPMLGTISGGAIIMPTVLPTVTERATLRQFIASLSGVTL